jgi:serine/threonine-protein kinase HSL1 (negative regulator of Swe1 kinase)
MCPPIPHHESLDPEGNLLVRAHSQTPSEPVENASATANKSAPVPQREPQVSATSEQPDTITDRRKTHVGPWQLGKTLGKGSVGRVRLARHAATGELAAIKIISKQSSTLAPSTSVAQMQKKEPPLVVEGKRPIPFSIEREIVILKLIEHENIVNLYDVWENRGEIYLVMEYAEGGELFEYVSSRGFLPEHEAVRLFRQIIAGLSYCHRFSICHRDLKPENLLIDSEKNIKLADFGMAALQPEGRWLKTSCGSPHYAAPEIIWGKDYDGAQADVWSCGIILYAMISGSLPFDGKGLTRVLQAVKKGTYNIPTGMSHDAEELIGRILQQNPDKRIRMEEIWEHPLVTKYEAYHASLLPKGKQLVGPPPPLHEEECGERITSQEDIDTEIFRNLQTLWHGYNKVELVEALISEGPNLERLLYQALLKFREEQREDYRGSLQYSKSDYHHALKPASKPAKRGARGNHTRQGSQYAIVANDGTNRRGSHWKKSSTAAATANYDPYRASMMPILEGTDAAPKVVVHRESSESASVERSRPAFTSEEMQKIAHYQKFSRSGATSKSSITSTRRDRVIQASSSHKRLVKFDHRRHKSSGNATNGSDVTGPSYQASNDAESQMRTPSKDTYYGMSDMQDVQAVSRTPQMVRTRDQTSELDLKKTRRNTGVWREDARKVSTELGRICEEAFNRSSGTSIEVSRSQVTSSPAIESPATAMSVHRNAIDAGKALKLDAPDTHEQQIVATALKQLAGTRQQIIENWGDSDPAGLVEIITRLDERIRFEQTKLKQAEQRAASDPTHMTATNGTHTALLRDQKLPANTNTMDDLMDYRQERAASDPGKSKQFQQDNTVRLVSPDPMSPGVPIEPLQIRKKNQVLMPLNSLRGGSSAESVQNNYGRGGYDPRLYSKDKLEPIEEDGNTLKKPGPDTTARKWSWLGKRITEQEVASKEQSNKRNNAAGEPSTSLRLRGARGPGDVKAQAPSKKWLAKVFSRKEKVDQPAAENQHAILLFSDDENESTSSVDQKGKGKQVARRSYPPATSVDAAVAASTPEPIQINQNWFAKFFHIKPASKILMLHLSRVKARREILKLLREWRQYGLRGVVAENIACGAVIRARVDAQNREFMSSFSSGSQMLTCF